MHAKYEREGSWKGKGRGEQGWGFQRCMESQKGGKEVEKERGEVSRLGGGGGVEKRVSEKGASEGVGCWLRRSDPRIRKVGSCRRKQEGEGRGVRRR